MDAQEAAGHVYDAVIDWSGRCSPFVLSGGRLTKIDNVDTKISTDTPQETPTPAPPTP